MVKWQKNLIGGVLLFTGVLVCIAAANTPGFQRYQVIVDRKPFGEAPPEPTPTPPPPLNANESFARSLRLSALLEMDDGSIRVGLVDNATKKDFFLSEGEIVEGIELVSASYEDEEAVLRKGTEMAVIKLQSGEIQPLTQTEQVERLERTEKRRLSYAERRKAREDRRRERQEAIAAAPKLTGEELEQHLKEYQMDVIRQGMPPLPIPLTQEMDDQLVAEGVLPPAE
ncbi:MAG: hypothetical protein EOM12_05320 [Verrucomicrobiae bacterium]|nr:hypothetical protein [Verrucomicrobiae bacterium]